ncbi:artemin-like [Narcine bancroftii]|uniref:artemin-like n=1 Tax=Narcine bancroftii TaxID=1343680 RepID=UPI0038321AEB
MMTFPMLLAFLIVFPIAHQPAGGSASPETRNLAQHLPENGANILQESNQEADGEFIVSPSSRPVSSLEAQEPRSYSGRSRRKRKMFVMRRGEVWEQNCRLRSLHLQVQDLGLGYQSDEVVPFNYCSGSCPLARTNHDLTLSLLLRKADLLDLSREKIISDPCCRPVQFRDVTFLDTNNHWQRVEKLSAAECSCIG